MIFEVAKSVKAYKKLVILFYNDENKLSELKNKWSQLFTSSVFQIEKRFSEWYNWVQWIEYPEVAIPILLRCDCVLEQILESLDRIVDGEEFYFYKLKALVAMIRFYAIPDYNEDIYDICIEYLNSSASEIRYDCLEMLFIINAKNMKEILNSFNSKKDLSGEQYLEKWYHGYSKSGFKAFDVMAKRLWAHSISTDGWYNINLKQVTKEYPLPPRLLEYVLEIEKTSQNTIKAKVSSEIKSKIVSNHKVEKQPIKKEIQKKPKQQTQQKNIKSKAQNKKTNIVSSEISHTDIQGMLAEIGIREGYDIHIATNDRSRPYNKGTLNDLSIEHMPYLNIDSDDSKRIGLLDIIWLIKKSPFRTIEVEKTTDINDALITYSDILKDIPHLRIEFSIVIPIKRLEKLKKELLRSSFEHLRISYATFENIHNAYEKLKATPEGIDAKGFIDWKYIE